MIGTNLSYKNLPWYNAHDKITSITIGEGVTDIGGWAFHGCSAVTEVTIPDSVERIGVCAFSNNYELKEITVGSGVNNIEDRAFENCSKLLTIVNYSALELTVGSTNNGRISFNEGCVINSGFKTTTVEGLRFIYGDGKAYLSDGSAATGAVTLPSSVTFDSTMTVNSYAISAYAFRNNANITSVVIPAGVTSVGAHSFEGCSKLTSVTVGNDVTKIGVGAFKNCTSLNSVNLGTGIASIGDEVFMGCSKLPSITIADNVTAIGNNAFDSCTSLSSVTFPSGLKEIGRKAFLDCKELGNVTLPAGLTHIGESAFENCSKLVTDIPSSMKSIGKNAFKNCTSLRTADIPSGTYYLGLSVFEGCTGLTSASIGTGVYTVPYRTFALCTGLKTVSLPSDLTVIGVEAFKNAGLTSVSIPGVKLIDISTFEGCSDLKTVTFKEGTETIGERAFYNCGLLENFTLPAGLKNIEYNSFYGCAALTEVTFPSSVTGISDSAFAGCTEIASFKVAAGNGTFWSDGISLCVTEGNELMKCPMGATGVSGKYILPEVTSIGTSAFSGCTGLTEIVIPSSVNAIGNHAFQDCAGLVTVTVKDSTETPSGLTSIAYGMFYNCTSLTGFTIPSKVTEIEGYAFSGCSGMISFAIPEGVETVGANAFKGCAGLETVNLPKSLIYVADSSFIGCTSLTRINVADGNTAYYTDASGALFQKGLNRLFVCPGGFTEYIIPEGTKDVSVMAFTGSALKKLTIASTLIDPSDGKGSGIMLDFKGCENLDKIILLSDQQFTFQFVDYGYMGPIDIPLCTVYTDIRDASDNINTEMKDPVARLVFKPLTCHVTFKADNGTPDVKRDAYNGETVTLPPNPVKNGGEGTTYAFQKWVIEGTETEFTADYVLDVNSFDDVNITVVAVYGTQGVTHDVTFEFKNGTGNHVETVGHRGNVTNLPEDPVKAADERYTYVFDKWVLGDGTEFTSSTVVTRDMTVTAQYTKTDVKYTVTFLFGNDEREVRETVYEGTVAPPFAFKQPSETKEYTFDKWTLDDGTEFTSSTVVTRNMTVTAKYTESTRMYNVHFDFGDNSNGYNVQVPYNGKVDIGKFPEDPVKEGDEHYTYEFDCWVMENGNEFTSEIQVTENISLMPKYNDVPVKYDVTFRCNGAIYGDVKKVGYGTAIGTLPTGPGNFSENGCTFEFVCWVINGNEIDADTVIVGATDVTARFKAVVAETPTVDDSGNAKVDAGKADSVTITADRMTDMSDNGLSTLDVNLGNGSVSLDADTVAGLPAGDVSVSITVVDTDTLSSDVKEKIGGRPVFDISLGDIHELGGKATVRIAYTLAEGEDADNLAIWYIDGDGNVTEMSCTYADGYVSFETDHFSKYAIMYEKSSGSDGDNTMIIVAVAVIALIAVLGLFLFMKSRKATV